MIRLDKSLQAWGMPDFNAILKQEIALLGAGQLPLQQGLSSSSYVTDGPITVMIHSVVEMERVIRIKAGIFYSGVIGGCSCADDSAPSGENDEYCEIRLDVDKTSAETRVALITE